MKKLLSILLAVSLLLTVPVWAAADSGVSVTDAVTDQIVSDHGDTYEYHIPEVAISGVDMDWLNTEIYDALYPDLESSLQSRANNDYSYASGGMSYSWSVHGDILSLVLQNYMYPDASGYDEYTVYDLSLATGQPVPEEDVLAQCGYTQDTYHAALVQAARNAHYESFSYVYTQTQSGGVQQSMADECLVDSLAEDNLATAVPFIHASGHLCATLGLYTVAAAGYYVHLLDLDDGVMLAYEPWSPDDAVPDPGTAPEPEPEAISETISETISMDSGSGADLVTDGYTYTYGDEWGDYGFHVPQIDREGPGFDEVNAAIWAELYEDQLMGEYGSVTAIEQGWSPEPYTVDYDWAVNGDILSLWTVSRYSGDCDFYSVYNVSLSAGRRVTNQELLDLAGVSEDQFYSAVRHALSAAFEEYNTYGQEDAFKAQQRGDNNSETNVRAVRPYLDKDGGLSVIGTVYALAGAGQFERQLSVMSQKRLMGPIDSSGLPDSPAESDPVIRFIERSGSEYLTPADIQGFNKQMCLYARNGVFARLGRCFEDASLQSYFRQFNWYRPVITPDEFDANIMNDYQRKNVALVLSYEESLP